MVWYRPVKNELSKIWLNGAQSGDKKVYSKFFWIIVFFSGLRLFPNNGPDPRVPLDAGQPGLLDGQRVRRRERGHAAAQRRRRGTRELRGPTSRPFPGSRRRQWLIIGLEWVAPRSLWDLTVLEFVQTEAKANLSNLWCWKLMLKLFLGKQILNCWRLFYFFPLIVVFPKTLHINLLLSMLFELNFQLL